METRLYQHEYNLIYIMNLFSYKTDLFKTRRPQPNVAWPYVTYGKHTQWKRRPCSNGSVIFKALGVLTRHRSKKGPIPTVAVFAFRQPKKTASGKSLVYIRIPLRVECNFLCSKYVPEFAAEKNSIQFIFPLQNPLPSYEPIFLRWRVQTASGSVKHYRWDHR